MQRVDVALSALLISRTQRGIRVDRTIQQGAQLIIGFGSQIEPGQHRLGQLKCQTVERLSHRQRQDEAIALPAQKITQAARPDQRQEDVRPRLHPIIAQRIAQAVVAMRQANPRQFRHVEHPTQPERRVDRKTRQRLDRLAGLQLQHIVQENDRLGQIDEEMAQPAAHRLGHDPLEPEARGAEHRFVDCLMHAEHIAVETLKRITLGVTTRCRNRPRRNRVDRRCGRVRNWFMRRNSPGSLGRGIERGTCAGRHQMRGVGSRAANQQQHGNQHRDGQPPDFADNASRWSTSAFAPPDCKTPAKSDRRIANWLIALR